MTTAAFDRHVLALQEIVARAGASVLPGGPAPARVADAD